MSAEPKEKPPFRSGKILAHLFAVLFLLGAVLSTAYAVVLLLARCEGFSCTYLGMAWMMWAGVLFAPTLACGLGTRNSLSVSPPFRTLLRLVFYIHLLNGAGLLCWWMIQSRLH